MENVPQKITLKDKSTLSSQILAQTLLKNIFISNYFMLNEVKYIYST